MSGTINAHATLSAAAINAWLSINAHAIHVVRGDSVYKRCEGKSQKLHDFIYLTFESIGCLFDSLQRCVDREAHKDMCLQ